MKSPTALLPFFELRAFGTDGGGLTVTRVDNGGVVELVEDALGDVLVELLEILGELVLPRPPGNRESPEKMWSGPCGSR